MTARLLLSSLVFLSQALAAGGAEAQWDRFRGPNGSGVAAVPGLKETLSEADRAWTLELPGKGHSSPVSWNDRIFLTAEDGTRPGVRWVLAVSAADGRELWRHEDRFETYPLHAFNSFAASTPACDADRVYVSWVSGTRRVVLALDHQGKKAWQSDLGFYREDHGSSASPIVVDDLLIVPNDHAEGADAGVYALDTATGTVRWHTPTKPEKTAFSTPVVVTAADGSRQLVFSSQPTALFALSPADGKLLWSHEHPVGGARAVGTPTVAADGVIFASTGQGGAGRGAVAVKAGSADGRTKPVLAWEAGNRIPYVPTPVAVGPHFYFLNDGGILSCVRTSDGERLWEERGPGKAYSSLVCLNGVLVAVGRDGTVMTARATTTHEPLGTLALGEECQTTPAVAGGRLLIRTNTKLHAFGGAPSTATP
jgi:outer membrane protein assembly factor BamB